MNLLIPTAMVVLHPGQPITFAVVSPDADRAQMKALVACAMTMPPPLTTAPVADAVAIGL